MEYLDGITLRELARKMGRSRLEVALSFGIQIAEANAAIHAARILHRDNKPENSTSCGGDT